MMILKPHRRIWRNALSMFSIAISFGMLLSLISVAWGLGEAAEDRSRGQPRDMVISSLGIVPTIEDSHIRSRELKNDERNFSAAMPVLTMLGRLAFPRENGALMVPSMELSMGDSLQDDLEGSETVGLVGLVPDLARDFMGEDDTLFIRTELLKMNGWFNIGSDPFYESDYTTGWTGEIIIDQEMAKRYDLEIGSPVYYINSSGKISASFVLVSTFDTFLMGEGLSSDIIGGIAMIHLSELQFLTNNHIVSGPGGERRDLSTAIYLDIQNDRSDASTQKEIAIDLEKAFPGLQVTTKERRLYRIEDEILILKSFSIGVGAITVMIGLFFLSSVMLIGVEERRKEIGILRAMGVSRLSIFKWILSETLIIAVMGSVIGLIPGYAGSHYLDIYLRGLYGVELEFTYMSPTIMLMCFCFLIVTALIFSLIPGYRAASVDPVRFMRE